MFLKINYTLAKFSDFCRNLISSLTFTSLLSLFCVGFSFMPRNLLSKAEYLQLRNEILCLNRIHPTWTPRKIAEHLKSGNTCFPGDVRRLTEYASNAIKRGTISDIARSGRRKTVLTPRFQRKIVRDLKHKNGAAIRKTAAKIKRNSGIGSRSSVHRIAKLNGLKWWKRTKTQKEVQSSKTDKNSIKVMMKRNKI